MGAGDRQPYRPRKGAQQHRSRLAAAGGHSAALPARRTLPPLLAHCTGEQALSQSRVLLLQQVHLFQLSFPSALFFLRFEKRMAPVLHLSVSSRP